MRRCLTVPCDGGGTRVGKTDPFTGAHNYSFGPGGIISDSAGSTTYTPGFAHREGTTDRFYHSDWLSSTRYLTDGTGNTSTIGMRYDAFGNRTATAGSDPYDATEFQFAGGAGYGSEYASYTEVGIGLQYLNQRYYDPAIGRFISPDPLGGANLYDYCGNNPVGGMDPSGMDPSFASTWLQYVGESYLSEGQAIAQGWGRALGWLTRTLPDRVFAGGLKLLTHGFHYDGPSLQATPFNPTYPRLAQGGRQITADINHMGGIIVSQAALGAVGLAGEGSASELAEGSSCSSLDELSQAAGEPDRNGLTRAGRALQKHGNRPGSLFPELPQQPDVLNPAGQDMVDDILTHPGTRTRVMTRPDIGEVVDYIAPDGRGVRFTKGGKFIGFREIRQRP